MKNIGLGVVALAAALSIASGSTQQVSKRGSEEGSADPYAPVNEGKGGTVKYVVTFMDSKTAANRRDAYKQMHDHCGGPYKITSERTAHTNEYGSNYETEWVVVDYDCVPDSAPNTVDGGTG